MSDFDKATKLVREQAEIVFNDYREKLNARFEDVITKSEIERMDNRLDSIQAELDAANAMLKGGSFTTGSDKGDRAEADYSLMFAKALIHGDRSLTASEISIARDYEKSMNVSSNTAGGFLVPKSMASKINEQVEVKVPFFNISTVEDTTLSLFPFIVQTSTGTAGLATEIATSANTAEPAVQEVNIKAYNIDAEPQITRDLLEDASFNVIEFVTRNAVNVIADTFGKLIIEGNGTNQPLGLVASANTSSTYAVIKEVVTAANTGFTFDELLDLKYDLDARYDQTGDVAFVMSRDAVKAARKFKDNYGQYLWQPALTIGAPALIDGDAVYVSPYLDNVAATKHPIFYGNWKEGSAIIRQTNGFLDLVDPYTSKRFIKVYMKQRYGFGTVDARALRSLKIKA